MLTKKPEGTKLVGCRWLYKPKEVVVGAESTKHKASLVVQGFTQVEGVDYTEAFSPIVKYTSIRILLSIVVQIDMHLEKMDIKTTFLHEHLKEKIYMRKPKEYVLQGSEDSLSLEKIYI